MVFLINNSSTIEIDSILKDEKIIGLPKTKLEHFQEFDKELGIDNELVKKMKCFIIINMKGMAKINDDIMAVIPKIISKDVQLQFSAFGRETSGKKKLNFSSTNAFKYLQGYYIITYNRNAGFKGLKSI
ncbi:unnamed protein product [Macrosiphum euphorbiae]|uniref:Uncharacterized protein n=1 Tax=Macrosiphum euphorbiae TaxID=13131 RepID=A0AAV0YA87_9HEMI|nr:unnamed protein product [Macrosiphum euphorbiae]